MVNESECSEGVEGKNEPEATRAGQIDGGVTRLVNKPQKQRFGPATPGRGRRQQTGCETAVPRESASEPSGVTGRGSKRRPRTGGRRVFAHRLPWQLNVAAGPSTGGQEKLNKSSAGAAHV